MNERAIIVGRDQKTREVGTGDPARTREHAAAAAAVEPMLRHPSSSSPKYFYCKLLQAGGELQLHAPQEAPKVLTLLPLAPPRVATISSTHSPAKGHELGLEC